MVDFGGFFACCGPSDNDKVNRDLIHVPKDETKPTVDLIYRVKDQEKEFDKTVGENDVIVKVHFVALGNSDKEKITGNKNLGTTFSGKVKWAGAKVKADPKAVKEGDIVFGYTNDASGALHDWVRVPAS